MSTEDVGAATGSTDAVAGARDPGRARASEADAGGGARRRRDRPPAADRRRSRELRVAARRPARTADPRCAPTSTTTASAAERERDEIRRYALADLLRDLLPVVDNLERALVAPGGTARGPAQGRRDDRSASSRTAAALGLARFAALGERFDPAHARGGRPRRSRTRRGADGGRRAAARLPPERPPAAAADGQVAVPRGAAPTA